MTLSTMRALLEDEKECFDDKTGILFSYDRMDVMSGY